MDKCQFSVKMSASSSRSQVIAIEQPHSIHVLLSIHNSCYACYRSIMLSMTAKMRSCILLRQQIPFSISTSTIHVVKCCCVLCSHVAHFTYIIRSLWRPSWQQARQQFLNQFPLLYVDVIEPVWTAVTIRWWLFQSHRNVNHQWLTCDTRMLC